MCDSKKDFHKQYISVDEQLAIIKARGLYIENDEQARHCLRMVSYYRLSGYFKPFQTHNSRGEHVFTPNTSFGQIWGIYTFDRELRLRLVDALERIEIALRTALINELSPVYGNLWYLAKEPFKAKWSTARSHGQVSLHQSILREVEQLCRTRHEPFIRHYMSRYKTPPYPPSWVTLECLSFGKLSNFYRHLKDRAIKRRVAKHFNLHPWVFESCLEPARYLRNLCAHHSRVWNRWFIYKRLDAKIFNQLPKRPNSLYEQVTMIAYLMKAVSPDSHWKEHVYDLFCRYEEFVPFELMGFQDWVNDPLWQI